MSDITSCVTLEPKAGGAPKKLVILLHGLGADGQDLIGLAPLWQDAAPTAMFLSPDAPQPCDMAPFGKQWFSLQDRDPKAILAGVGMAAPGLNQFIDDNLEKYNLEDKDVVVMGFSQGAMMSLYTIPRRQNACAGIMAYSGALVDDGALARGETTQPPVLVVHGEDDPIVSFDAFKMTKDGLNDAGFSDVEAHGLQDLMHGIDERGVAYGSAFLQKVLKD